MQEHVTLLGPVESPRERKSLSSTLPPDLMEQVRGRVRLLALLLLIAFSFDPLVYFGIWFIATVAGFPVIYEQLGFRLLDVGAVSASAALWWVARSGAVSSGRLLALGLGPKWPFRFRCGREWRHGAAGGWTATVLCADSGRTCRYLCERMCGILAADRPARFHSRHDHGAASSARACGSIGALITGGAAHVGGARPARALVSLQGSGEAPPIGQGAGDHVGGDPECPSVD